MSEGDRERAIFAEAVARAWKDSAFRAQLISKPKEALSSLGYKVGDDVEIHVVEDTAKSRHLSLPDASRFDEFRERLHSRIDRGLPLPEGVSLTLHQNTAKTKFFVLPLQPAATDQLSEDELASVAGGGSSSAVTTNVVGGVDAGAVAVVAGEVVVLT